MTIKINPFQKLLEGALFASISSFLFVSTALAGPNGAQIEAGHANITGQGTANVLINQLSNRVVINWDDFNTAVGESVEFRQLNASSLAVNRINNGTPTQILGALRANGQVIVINPNGVILGSGAHVDVNKLVISTADIATQNAMNDDKLIFDRPGNPNAKIINNGMITVHDAGLVGLVAPQVENNGIIQAKLGKIDLASGSTFTLDLAGDDLVSIALSDDVAHQLVKNTGTLKAEGGFINITAAAARQMVDTMLVNTGVIEANSATQHGGKIILGSGTENITNGGTLDASGITGGSVVVHGDTVDDNGTINVTGTNGVGGSAQILGRLLNLSSTSSVNASGYSGGGEINIGGDFQGQGNLQRAEQTIIDSGALIVNDAVYNGLGGNTVIWSDDHTQFAGHISAQGGSNGGDGGRVEVSGHNTLDFLGTVDTRAMNGLTGSLLLDPADITITTAADSNVTGTTPFQSSGAATSNLNVTTLQTALGTSNVTISSAAGTGGTGNITFTDAVAWNNANTLTVTASNNIIVNNDIINSGTGSITLNANVAAAGSITLNGNITTGGSITALALRDITLNATKTVTSGATGSISLQAANAVTTGTGNLSLNGNISVGTGGLTLTSGVNGTRPSWTATVTNLVRQGATFGAVSIQGFQDLVINRDINSNSNITLLANRDLTLNAANILTTGSTGALSARAANAVTTGTGNLNLNGTISVGTGGLTLLSGVNGTRPSYTMATTNVVRQGATFGAISIQGYQDLTINRDLNSNGAVTILSNRDVTLNAANTIVTGSTSALSISAANGVATGTGNLNLNGNMSVGTGSLTLISGINGTRPTWTMSSTSLVRLGATFGAVNIQGFNDVVVNRQLNSTSTVAFANNTRTVLQNTVSSSAGAVTFSNAVTVGEGTSATVSTTDQPISFLSTINDTVGGATESLTVNPGTSSATFGGTIDGVALSINGGTLSFNGALGGTNALGTTSITSVNALSLPSITASGITIQTTGAGNVLTLNGALTSTGASAAMSVTSNGMLIKNTGNISTNNAGITLSAATTLYLGNSFNINSTGGNISLTGPSGIISAGTTTINTGGGNLNIANALTISAPLTLTLGSGALTFGSTINGAAAFDSTIDVLTVGAGGGGGGADSSNRGSGGGAGSVVDTTITTSGSAYNVTVGGGGGGAASSLATAAGGAAGANGGGAGGLGGTSGTSGGGAGGGGYSAVSSGGTYYAVAGGGAGGGGGNEGTANDVAAPGGNNGQPNGNTGTMVGGAGANFSGDGGGGGGGGGGLLGGVGQTNVLTSGQASAGTSYSNPSNTSATLTNGANGQTQAGGSAGGAATSIAAGRATYYNYTSTGAGGAGGTTSTAGTNGGNGTVVIRYTGTASQAIIVGGTTTTVGGDTVVTYNGTTNGVFAPIYGCAGNCNLSVTAGSVSFGGAVGGTTALNNVNITTTNNMSLPAITADNITASINAANKTITTTGALTVGSGDISLTSDDLVLGGNVVGTGTLTLQPLTPGRIVNVNQGTADGTNYNLSTAEIARIIDGWSTINIGRTNGTADLFVGASTWNDPVNFRNSTRITVNGALVGTGNSSFTFTGSAAWVDLYNSITTAGQKIDFSNASYIWVGSAAGGGMTTGGGSVLFNKIFSQNNGGINVVTSGGNISIADTIYGGAGAGKTYSFDAGSGTVSFANTVNAAANITAIGSGITLSSAWGGSSSVGNVTLTATNSLSLPSITTAAGKTVSATVTGAGNSITASTIATGTNGNITLVADDLTLNGNLSGTGTVTLQPNSTSRVIRVNYGAGDFNLSTAEIAKLVEGWSTINIGRTDNATDMFLGTSTWTDPVNFRNGNRVTIEAANTLTGTDNGSFTFSGSNSWADIYGSIVTAGQLVSFAGNNRIDSYNGSISTHGGDVSFNKLEVYSGGGDTTVDSGNGNINIATMTDNANNATGKLVSLNAGSGTVSFASAVSGKYNVTVSGGAINFGGAWGGGASLGTVSLTTTSSALTLPGIAASSIFAQSATGTNLTLTGALTASGGGNDIVLASGKDFINSGGSLNPGSGRYLVYSADPSQNALGGITVATKRYNKTYAGYAPGSVTETGNVFLYSIAPVITVTADNQTKVYGDANPALTASYGGYIDGDTFATAASGAPDLSTTAVIGSNIGSYAITSAAGTLASTLGYTFSYVAGSLSVTPATLTVKADNQTKIYGDANPTLTLNFTGLKNGDANSVFTGYGLSTMADNLSNVGSYAIALTGGSAGSNYTVVRTDGTLSVTPAALTITADNQMKIYGAAVPTLTASYGGFVNGDTSSVISGLGLSTTGTAVSHVGNYGITASGASASNYTISYVGGNLSITRAALTITADNQSKVYGAALPALTASYGGLVNGDTSSVVLGLVLSTTGTAASNVGTYGITASGASAGDYTISYVGGTLSVTPAALTVVADDQTKIYGNINPALTLSYTGLVNGDTGAVFSGYSLTTTAVDGSNVGSYGINLTGGTASNYTVTRNNGTLAVTPADLTITVNDKSKIYGDHNPGLTASYSGFKNGDTTSVVSGLNLSTAADDLSGVGSYTISASGATASNYTITQVDGHLTVTPASLTIVADNQSKTYGDANPLLTLGFTGLKNGDVGTNVFTGYGLTTTAVDGSNVGTYAINLTGGTAANYTITRHDGVLSVTPANLSVMADSTSKIYGAHNPGLTLTISGLKNGDTDSIFTGYSLGTVANDLSNVGSYAITLTGGTAGSNYTVTTTNGTLSVTAANLIIQAVSTTKTYGDHNPTLTLSFSGLQGSDTGSVFTGYGLSTTAVNNSGVGGYVISLTGGTAANYAISRLNGTLTVTPAPLTIQADGKVRTYGDPANPSLTATYIGLKGTDTSSIVTGLNLSTPVTATTDVGSYAITPAGASVGANYTISYVNGTMTVIPAPLTVQAVSTTKTYGTTNPALALNYAGLKNGDDGAMVYTGYSLSTTAADNSNVGSYAINLSGGSATNYAITTVNGTLTVTPAALTVQADSKAKIYGAANPALTLTFTGLVNGDTNTIYHGYSLTTAAADSDVGTYGIHLSGGSVGSNYTLTRVDGTLTVTPASLAVQADSKVKTYGNANPGLTLSYTGLVNGDTGSVFTGYSLTTSAVTGSNVGSYAINLSGGTAANYILSTVNGTLTVTPAALTVLADSKVKTYGDANPALTLTFSGLKNGDVGTNIYTGYGLSTAADASSGVGTYTIVLTGGAVTPNYTLTGVNGNLTVTPASLIVRADNQSKTHGDPNPAFTLSLSGLKNGDLSSIFSGYSISSAATTSSPAGNYTIALTGGSAGSNYTVTRVNGLLVVSPDSSTVTPGIPTDGDVSLPYKQLWQPYVPAIASDDTSPVVNQVADKRSDQHIATMQSSCLYKLVNFDGAGSVSFGNCNSGGR